jgi:NAD(P)-dependent dehydrogenase (short-subunit alcohol dehydrogenase family)
MDIAIVTGAETPLGLRIVQTLVQQGCRVHGIGNNFSKVTYADPQFKGHAVDLTDLDAVVSILGNILEEEQRLDILIHAIDVTPGTAFDKLPAGNLEAILKIGLLGPVMMTRLALPNLLRFRGQLINVITANKHGHPSSAANALIEGGLREMNKALFDQGRDAGLRITNCLLRQNAQLSGAKVGDEAIAQSHINLADVTRTIVQLIDPKAVNVPAEIVLHPRLSATGEEALPAAPLPLDPYAAVVLPPKAYCPPEQPKIPTEEKQQIDRTIPYTDEEMEDKIAAAIEDFEAHPERYDQPDRPPAKQKHQGRQQQGGQQQGGQQQGSQQQGGQQQGGQQQGSQQQGGQQQGGQQQGGQQQGGQQHQGNSQEEGQGNNKRRRRRGGRNRNKKPQDGGGPKPQDAPAPQEQRKPKPQDAPESQPQKKPKPQKKPDHEVTDKPDRAPKPKPVKKTAEKTAEKTAAKKATKKAAKKAVKKPVKKVAKKKVAAKKAVKRKAAKEVE